MPFTFKRVRPGDKVRADDHNQGVEAAGRQKVTAVGQGLQLHQTPAGTQIALQPGTLDRRTAQSGFWARITGRTLDGIRWTYNFESVRRTTGGWEAITVVTGGIQGQARNTIETPEVDFQYAPIRTGTVVRVFGEWNGTGLEFWFQAGSNADTYTDAELKTLGFQVGQQDGDRWDIRDDQGKGLRLKLVADVYNDEAAKALKLRSRELLITPSGRVYVVDAESSDIVFAQGEVCSE